MQGYSGNKFAMTSGVYTPTLTNTTNVTGSTAFSMSWERVGNVLTGFFHANVDPTGGVATTLTFTLPIACTSTPTGGGCANCANNIANVTVGYITMASATTATLNFFAADTTNNGWYGMYQYVVN